MIENITTVVAEERIRLGIRRNGYTPCDADGCEFTPADGPLFRVNPKGEAGIFMCAAHARAIDAPPREPR